MSVIINECNQLMSVIICPGVHPPELTDHFLNSLQSLPPNRLVFPADRYPAFSAWDIFRFLQTRLGEPAQQPLMFLGFSAGVVGAVGAATLWHRLGGSVKALVACDGWGVPLCDRYPIYRISHDSFTHWSSSLLGAGKKSFYADPPVAHLELWRSPDRVQGWWIDSAIDQAISGQPNQNWMKTTASQFLNHLLAQYDEIASEI
ncbi:MAG: hypothetical protein Kow00121_53680 [Elainellaceae cyanobacterium]